jgi:ribonuclease BN (tRNA processing enzyme)
LRITVIGRSPAWQDEGGACSGYLVEAEGAKVLVDCGNGVFGKLRSALDHREIDSVVISHMHGDHILDLVPFAYALSYGPERRGGRPALYLPPGGKEVLRRICGAFDAETLIEDAFETSEYEPDAGMSIGPIELAFSHVPHFIDAWSISMATADSGRFVFGADCGPCDSLVGFSQGCELLMLEATIPHGGPASDGHLTSTQAGEIARKAQAGRLVLTHASDFLDLAAERENAALAFGGPVEVSAEGSSWLI